MRLRGEDHLKNAVEACESAVKHRSGYVPDAGYEIHTFNEGYRWVDTSRLGLLHHQMRTDAEVHKGGLPSLGRVQEACRAKLSSVCVDVCEKSEGRVLAQDVNWRS